jgi:hypothetical protein
MTPQCREAIEIMAFLTDCRWGASEQTWTADPRTMIWSGSSSTAALRG